MIRQRDVSNLSRFGLWRRLGLLISFPLLWFLFVGAILGALYYSGLVPQHVKEIASDVFNVKNTTASAKSTLTTNSAYLIIPKIGLTSPIVFPTSTDLDVLKKALYSGVVHYPGSVLPGQTGNVFIFGHSSSKLFVRNPAWTVFTNIHKLDVGDSIDIRLARVKYHYRVTSVEILNPNEDKIYLASDKPKLTLSTCWPVGDPKERTVVEAELVMVSHVEPFLEKFLID